MRAIKTKTLATYAALGAAPLAVVVPNTAFAAIETTEVVNTIKGASVAVDAVGLAIIGVITGILVVGLIVRMLMRKGA